MFGPEGSMAMRGVPDEDAEAADKRTPQGREPKTSSDAFTTAATGTTGATGTPIANISDSDQRRWSLSDLFAMGVTVVVFAALTLLPLFACLWWVALVLLTQGRIDRETESIYEDHFGVSLLKKMAKMMKMGAMKAMKAMKKSSMKKGMKKMVLPLVLASIVLAMKKATSSVAKGKLAKSRVFYEKGGKTKTSGGLQKSDLKRNKSGKVVSAKASAAAKKRKGYKKIVAWGAATAKARKALNIQGFCPVGGATPQGKQLLAKVRSLYK
eukprot:g12820.t1